MPQGRLAAVLADRWLLLMLLAGGVMAFVVVVVIGFSGALYTSQSTSPGNEFAAGSIDLDIEQDGELLDAEVFSPAITAARSRRSPTSSTRRRSP